MSGIYIPGMEMPKYGCENCFLRTGIYCGRITKNENVVEYAKKSERHPDCPLIPVPEHGELIEREPIIDVMRKERDRISETYGPNDEYVNCLNKYAISMVTSAKPIIPADKEGEE